MAVIVSNGPTNLSATGGFYRAESYNLSANSSSNLILTSKRQIPVTFANAGNCQGIILYLSAVGHCTKDVIVKFQENTGTWVDRDTITVSASTITNGVSNNTIVTWVVPIMLTTPYAITTASNKWRFEVSQGASGTMNWVLRTSNSTDPSYITWCDNVVSYTNGDVLIAKDKVTIDQTCRFNGVLSTGDTTGSVCGVACSSTSGDYTSNAMIEWQNTPASSYTMTLNGFFYLAAHAGFHVGTELNRIPIAKQAIIEVIPATSGTNTNTGLFSVGNVNHSNLNGRMNIQMYGEKATNRTAILASDAAANQKDIVTTTSTGWSVGDKIYIGKMWTNTNPPETTPYEITSISGPNITVERNIQAYIRKAGGHVLRQDVNGIEWKQTHTGQLYQYVFGVNNFVLSGVTLNAITYANTTNSIVAWLDDPANIGQILVEDCFMYNGNVGALKPGFGINFADKPITFQRINIFKSSLIFALYGRGRTEKIVRDNIIIHGQIADMQRVQNMTIDNNVFYNLSGQFVYPSGTMTSSTISNNYFWGANSGMVYNSGMLSNVKFINNQYEYGSRGIWNVGAMIDCISRDEKFGLEAGNFPVFWTGNTAPITDILFNNPTIGTGVTPVMNSFDGADGSKVRFQDYNQVTNVDFTVQPFGTITKTGTGLADTTVRTAGGYAMRFEPDNPPNQIRWEQTVPTGDIQNKTMTVSVWVKINNANYYAGTHDKPTLTIDYDEGTTITSTALGNTNWQLLACTFTPTTDYGQIEMAITGSTDATGANSYFYADDINIAYPAGVAINLGNLDLWAAGLPVVPTISTMPSLGGVWDEPLTAHTIPGSTGAVVGEVLSNTDVTQAKVDTL